MFTDNSQEEKKEKETEGCPHCRVSKETLEILKNAKKAEGENKEELKEENKAI